MRWNQHTSTIPTHYQALQSDAVVLFEKSAHQHCSYELFDFLPNYSSDFPYNECIGINILPRFQRTIKLFNRTPWRFSKNQLIGIVFTNFSIFSPTSHPIFRTMNALESTCSHDSNAPSNSSIGRNGIFRKSAHRHRLPELFDFLPNSSSDFPYNECVGISILSRFQRTIKLPNRTKRHFSKIGSSASSSQTFRLSPQLLIRFPIQ